MRCSECNDRKEYFTCVGNRYCCAKTGRGLNTSIDIDPECPIIKEDISILKKYCKLRKVLKPKTMLVMRDNEGEILFEVVMLNKRYYLITENGSKIRLCPIEEIDKFLTEFRLEHLKWWEVDD
jgi:hypothetical protein